MAAKELFDVVMLNEKKNWYAINQLAVQPFRNQ